MTNEPYVNNDVNCTNCGSSIRMKSLIKLKDRYCCPNCFCTIKVTKHKEQEKENDVKDGRVKNK